MTGGEKTTLSSIIVGRAGRWKLGKLVCFSNPCEMSVQNGGITVAAHQPGLLRDIPKPADSGRSLRPVAAAGHNFSISCCRSRK